MVKFAGCYHGHVACVITEACPANMGVVPPAPGFNALLASLCRSSGAVLIMDEVLTGFRVSPSGWYGLDGVRGDLVTFGKVMGGGLPAAAFGGGARIVVTFARLDRCTRRARCPVTRSRWRPGWLPCAPVPRRCTPGSMPPPARWPSWPPRR